MNDKISIHQSPTPVSSNTGDVPKTKDQATLMMVRKLFDQGKKARAKWDQYWQDRIDFYLGNQWNIRTVPGSIGGLDGVRQERPSYRSAPVMNICRSTIQSLLPILTDARPGFNILPTEPQDFKFAQLLQKLVTHWWDKTDMDHTVVEWIMDSMIFDAGILKVTWDQDADHGRGEIKAEVIASDEIYVPYTARDFNKNCPWVIHDTQKSVGWLKAKFPKYKDKIKPDTTLAKEGQGTESEYSTNVGLVSPTDQRATVNSRPATESVDVRKTALYREVWIDDDTIEEFEKTNEETGEKIKEKRKKFPNGRLISLLPNQKLVLQDVKNPYDHGKKPFVRTVDMLVPRQFWGDGEVGPLMNNNKVLNKILSNILDYMSFTANPMWRVEKGSGVDPDQLTNQFGLVITTNQGKLDAVKRDIPPALPPYLWRFYDLIMRQVEQISGTTELSQGRRVEGDPTAAAAIQSLQEAAFTRIRLKERNLQVSLGQLGEIVISLIMQFYTEPRVARISNEGSQFPEFFEFYVEDTPNGKVINRRKYDVVKDDLVPDGPFEGTAASQGIFDVKVMSGTAMPQAKAQRATIAMKLFEGGVIDDEELLKTLEWADYEQVLERMREKKAEMAQAEAQRGGI